MKILKRLVFYCLLVTIPVLATPALDKSIRNLADRLADCILTDCDNPIVSIDIDEDFSSTLQGQNSIKQALLDSIRDRIHAKLGPMGKQEMLIQGPSVNTPYLIKGIIYYTNDTVPYLFILKDRKNTVLRIIDGKLPIRALVSKADDVLLDLKKYWAVIAIFLGLPAIFYYILMVKANRKATYATVANKIISKFNERELIEARGSILKQNLNYESVKDYLNRYDSLLHREIDIILSSFDEAGMLVVRKLVPKEYLLPVYWAPTIICWVKLYEYVTKVKWQRYRLANVHFVAFTKKALEYWADYFPKCELSIMNYESRSATEAPIDRVFEMQRIQKDIDDLRPLIAWWEHCRLFRKDFYHRRIFRAFSRFISNIRA